MGVHRKISVRPLPFVKDAVSPAKMCLAEAGMDWSCPALRCRSVRRRFDRSQAYKSKYLSLHQLATCKVGYRFKLTVLSTNLCQGTAAIVFHLRSVPGCGRTCLVPHTSIGDTLQMQTSSHMRHHNRHLTADVWRRDARHKSSSHLLVLAYKTSSHKRH